MIEELIDFRRDLHQHPEKSYHQFETTKRIKAMAIRLGVKQEWITLLPTNNGLWIDICGQAPPDQKNVCIALRADIDALDMTQNNEFLPYRSVNIGAAHMCGHDGHTACLMALIPLLLAEISNISSNKSVRLLFQPAQETDRGALQMIEQGCLKGVNQIYGFHNVNNLPLGKFFCKDGPLLSLGSIITIEIYGTRGQYNCPQVKHFALEKAVAFYRKMLIFIQQLSEKQEKEGRKFICTLPVFKSGESHSIISENVYIQGTSRSYSEQATQILVKKITEELRIIQSQGFTYKLSTYHGSILKNQSKSAQHLLRLAKLQFGQQNVVSTQALKGSEDFGYYLRYVPGAFFFFGGEDESHSGFPHNPNYNFNDEIIAPISKFWMRLVKDRFGLTQI